MRLIYNETKQGNYINSVFYTYLIFGILSIVGYIANIVQIVSIEPFEWTGLVIIKSIGVLVPPLGSLLGLIGFFT